MPKAKPRATKAPTDKRYRHVFNMTFEVMSDTREPRELPMLELAAALERTSKKALLYASHPTIGGCGVSLQPIKSTDTRSKLTAPQQEELKSLRSRVEMGEIPTRDTDPEYHRFLELSARNEE